MKLFALHISYKIMIYSFISLPFCPDPDPQIYADPDPGRAKTCGSCGSGSETLGITLKIVKYIKIRTTIFSKKKKQRSPVVFLVVRHTCNIVQIRNAFVTFFLYLYVFSSEHFVALRLQSFEC